MKIKPNLSVLEKLYEFGGLQAYEIQFFDEINFTTKVDSRTFSKEKAKRVCENLRAAGLKVVVKSYFVHFDGAFSQD